VGQPERQCIGCGRRGPQSGLLRLLVAKEGAERRVVVDDGSARAGRGAYLCKRQACLERAVMRKAFQRAFRTSVVVSRDEISAAMSNGTGEEPDGFECR
jgi:predicted RNA-binding protein YlxR (DUF448 family)